jgi:transposase
MQKARRHPEGLRPLVGTCKMHGINPFIYLKNAFQRIGSHPINQIEMLLPQNWKAGG